MLRAVRRLAGREYCRSIFPRSVVAMRTLLALSLLSAIVVTANVARAEEVGDSAADLRCLSIMAKINQLPDARHQLESLIGGYYYLGRITAAKPDLDVPSATAEAFGRMSAAEFLTETGRCEKEMQNRGKSMSGIAAAMPKPQENPKPAP
jgi:hypothetical protein